MKFWLYQSLIAFDQLCNALVCKGWADETLSSNCYRMEQEGRPFGKLMRPTIDTLLWFDPQHCKVSFESERLRLQSPPEART